MRAQCKEAGVELESGFVVAVIVAVVLLADRLGDSDSIARRMFQAALGITLAVCVVAGTTAIILDDEARDSQSFSSEDEDGQDALDRVVVAASMQAALGAVLLITGVTMLSRYRTVALGVVLGGLLLALGGGTGDQPPNLLTLFTPSVAISREVNVLQFVMLALATGVLGWFGYWRWDQAESSAAASDIPEA
jgi:hypothetical protein